MFHIDLLMKFGEYMRKRILYLGCGMILVCIIITVILGTLVVNGAFEEPISKNAKAFFISADNQ